MTLQNIIYGLIRAIHNIGSSIWIGGLLILVFTFIPTARKFQGKSPEIQMMIGKFYQMLTKMIAVTIPVLFISGIYLARMNSNFLGFFNFSNTYSTIMSLKIILVIVMLLILFLRKKNQKKYMQTKENKYNIISERFVIVNTVLGIIVIFLSSVMVVL